jgi:hypothetical protein
MDRWGQNLIRVAVGFLAALALAGCLLTQQAPAGGPPAACPTPEVEPPDAPLYPNAQQVQRQVVGRGDVLAGSAQTYKIITYQTADPPERVRAFYDDAEAMLQAGWAPNLTDTPAPEGLLLYWVGRAQAPSPCTPAPTLVIPGVTPSPTPPPPLYLFQVRIQPGPDGRTQVEIKHALIPSV